MSKQSDKTPPVCLVCESRKALVQIDLCRDHLALLQGFSGLEDHHPEGRKNSPATVIQPVSIHAEFTSKMNYWSGALRSPSKNPLLKIARRLQVVRDLASWFLDATERDVDWLIALGLVMEKDHGPDWSKRKHLAALEKDNAGD